MNFSKIVVKSCRSAGARRGIVPPEAGSVPTGRQPSGASRATIACAADGGQCAAFRPGQPYCPRIDYARSEYKADRANDLVRSPLPRHHSLARTSARPRVFRSFPHTRNGGSGIDEWMGANSTVDRSGSRILPVLLPDDNPLLQATHSDSNPSERPSTSTDIPLQQAFRLAIRSDKHSIPTVPTGHPLRQAFQI